MLSPRFSNRLRIVWRALWRSVRPRRKPGKERISRVLVAHNMLLGDTILLAALMKKIRREYPQAACFVLCRPGFIALLDSQPYGFQALPFDLRDAASIDGIFQQGPFDLAIVPDDNRYAWLARAAGARWIVGFAGDTPQWKNWMVDEAHSYPVVAQTWSDLMGGLIAGPPPEPFEQGEWALPEATLPGDLPVRYAVLHLGAGSPLRYWPPERWRELAQALSGAQLEPIFTTSMQERAQLDQIDPEHRYRRFPGDLTLNQMGQLLKRASLLVCADTGIAHLARLAAVPTVVLYGPGTPLLHGNGDFWQKHPERNVWQAPFPCRDQHDLFRRQVSWVVRCKRSFGNGPDQCPEPACMQALTVAVVVRQALNVTYLPILRM
jgi:ADP-heptose:LPS heptosyltransferase